ncbi:hypothetical protein D3C72_1535560 [compost metagenome]
MDLTRLLLPDGSTTISSPLCTTPLARVPAKPRKFRFGRLTYCTGKRKSVKLRSAATSTVSRISISAGPVYHGERSLRLTTLSPLSADIGTKCRLLGAMLMASANCR